MTQSAALVDGDHQGQGQGRDRRSFTGDTSSSSATNDSPTLNPSYLLPSNMMPDTPLDDLPASTLEAMATPDPSPTTSKPPAVLSSSSLPRTASTSAAAVASVSFAADLPLRSSSPLLHGHGPRRSASSTLLARSNSGYAFPSMSAAASASPSLTAAAGAAAAAPSSRTMSVTNLAGLARAGASTASLSALAAAAGSGGRNSPRPGVMLKGSASYAHLADAGGMMRGTSSAAARHSFTDMGRAAQQAAEYEYAESHDGWELERSMSTLSLQYPHNHNHNHTGSLQQHHHHRHQNNNMNGFSTSPSAPTHFGNASSPAIFPAIQQHLLQHTHAAFVWHPTSASAPSDSALTRQGNAILALYHAQLRDLPLGLPSTACSLSIATPGANPTPLRQVGLQLPHAAHLMDASDLALVTELLRLTLAGVKHLTIISDALGIQPALRHLSESGTVRVVWITSLPIQVVAASVPAVHVQSVDDMLWSSIPRNVSATHLAANVNGSSTNLAGANAAGTGASPLRYTTSAAQLSTMSSTASMSSASAASGHSPTLKPRAPPPPTQSQQQQQQQQLAPSGASSTSIASMTSSNPAFNPHPHPPHVTKWVPLGPPPDPEFIPLRHVSFGPLFHALHHPAIRDRLGPNYAQPIDLSLLGGILKQAMDPFASLKLYLQAAADCGLLRLSHMGSRCLLKVVNPNWLAQWEPYEPDCVLVPGVASSHLQRRTGSVVGLNNLASTAAAAANAGTDAQALGTPDDDMPLSEAELTPFLPLLHAFCMARMRYPPPIRTPAIGPLLKPMFARGDLAPWRKLSEYLADAEKRGVVTLTRLGVNGDVEVAVREKACAGVWEEVRERYGAFREASPAVPRDDEAAHANANVQFGGYVPQHQQPLPAHMYAAPPHQQAPYGHHPMHPPHLMYSQPMHVPQPHAYMAMPPTMLHPQPVTALMPPTSSSPPHSTSSAAKQARSPLATAAAMTVAHQPTSMSSSSSGDDDDEEEDDSAFTFTARSSAAATPLHGTSGASRNASVQSSPVHVNQIAGAPVVGPPPGF